MGAGIGPTAAAGPAMVGCGMVESVVDSNASIGSAAAGTARGVLLGGRKTAPLAVGACCAPTTVPPGNATAIEGSAVGTEGNAGDCANAVVPPRRAALVSHRRIPRMVCLAAV